jgi:hypothetical protein
MTLEENTVIIIAKRNIGELLGAKFILRAVFGVIKRLKLSEKTRFIALKSAYILPKEQEKGYPLWGKLSDSVGSVL